MYSSTTLSPALRNAVRELEADNRRLKEQATKAEAEREALSKASADLLQKLHKERAESAQLRRAIQIKDLMKSSEDTKAQLRAALRQTYDEGRRADGSTALDDDDEAEEVEVQNFGARSEKEKQLAHYRQQVDKLEEQVRVLSSDQTQVDRIQGELARMRETMTQDAKDAVLTANVKQAHIDRLEQQLTEAQKSNLDMEASVAQLMGEVDALQKREEAAQERAAKLESRLDALHHSPDRKAALTASRAKGLAAERERATTEQLLLKIRQQAKDLKSSQEEEAFFKAEADRLRKLLHRRLAQDEQKHAEAANSVAEAQRFKQELAHMKTRFTLLYVEHKKFVEQHATQQVQQTAIIQRIRRNIAQMKEKTRRDVRQQVQHHHHNNNGGNNNGQNKKFLWPEDSPRRTAMDAMNEIDYLISIVDRGQDRPANRRTGPPTDAISQQQRSSPLDNDDTLKPSPYYSTPSPQPNDQVSCRYRYKL